MRPIDADALKKTIDKEIFRHDTIDHVFQIIDDAPSIDICLCRECKYTEFCEKKIHRHGIAYSIDFCSYGCREEE